MSDNKNNVGNTPDELLSPEEAHKIEVKVDKMLDPKAPNPKPVADTKDSSPPPIDIFSDPKTAPEVPESVIKTMVGPTSDKDDQVEPEQKPTSD